MGCQYFPHTEEDLKRMLERAGAVSLKDLFSDVPEEFMFKGEFNLPDAMSEMEVLEKFRQLDALDKKLTVFCGAGAYDHYAPAVIQYPLCPCRDTVSSFPFGVPDCLHSVPG